MKSEIIKQTLTDKLKVISESEDFIIGVLSNATHDDDRLELIRYIDAGKDVNYEQIVMHSLWLGQQRDNYNQI